MRWQETMNEALQTSHIKQIVSQLVIVGVMFI